MTQTGIEPWSHGLLVNTLLISLIYTNDNIKMAYVLNY